MEVSNVFEPVTTVEELESLVEEEILAGYLYGLKESLEPLDKGKSYWHGWRNGMIDSHRMSMDNASAQLANAIVARTKERKSLH